MGFRDTVTHFFGLDLVERPQATLSTVEDAVDAIIHAREHPRSGVWRMPTVGEALGVPSIQRAVSLISSTTGMLSMQGFRNGVAMDDPPTIIVRPDPDQTPYEFYGTTAAQMAKYGEFVWWIAARDSDGNAAALVNVPLNELRIDTTERPRRFPLYKWGDIESTRWTPSNRSGQFVHKKYLLAEPYALRGEGPLQLGRVAVSISVESQIWAANFYGGGGHASDIIKHAAELDPTLRDEYGMPDPDAGLSEADRLKAQYIARDANTPLVIDQRIESITPGKIDEAGAQMLEARLHQNGDAARLFGLPGKFVEYVQSGTSLTYQTLESAFTDLVKTCLQPLYLEPIEQAMSDLLTRSTVARFNVKGFLRADIKTRYEVHGIAITNGIYGPDYAQREEGIAPGDVEYAPVPFAAPQAVPTSIPRVASTAMREVRCPSCKRLLIRAAGPVEGWCRHCKETVHDGELAVEPTVTKPTIEVHAHFPPDMVRVDAPVTIHPADVHVEPTFVAPAPAPMTLEVTTPDTERRVAALADEVVAFTDKVGGLIEAQAESHADTQAALAALAKANEEVAHELARSNQPKVVEVTRDPVNGQIVRMDQKSA